MTREAALSIHSGKIGRDIGASMLIHEGEERSVAVDIRLASMLAAVAGAVNAAGFYSVSYFSGNMTGNVSALSDDLALGKIQPAVLYASIVITFIIGACASTLMINYGRRRKLVAIYALSILTEAFLLAGLGLADLWLPGLHRSILLVLGLSFAMGLQNASATRISNARVRTTHVSGMATDIGIELAMLFDRRRNAEPDSEYVANLSKLWLHASTILAFLLGGIAGVAFYRIGGGALLIGAACLLLTTALVEIRRASVNEDVRTFRSAAILPVGEGAQSNRRD